MLRFSFSLLITNVELSSLYIVILAIGYLFTGSSFSNAQVLEEVIVSAHKRSENVNTVGVSMTVFSTQDIENLEIQHMRDFAGAIANVDMKEVVPGLLPVISIRGVSLNDFSANNTPTTGIYIDEVFLASTTMMSLQLFDIDQIEILKGPQGTLYGRNTTAGAVNIITSKPTNSPYISFGFDAGNYEYYSSNLIVNAPVNEILTLRLSLHITDQAEGYWQNHFQSISQSVGERDELSARLQTLWEPADTVDIHIKAESSDTNSEIGQPEFFGTVALSDSFPVTCQPIIEGRIDNNQCTDLLGNSDTDGDPFKVNFSGTPVYSGRQYGLTVTSDIDFDTLTLRSITSYQGLDRKLVLDLDGTPFRQSDFLSNEKIDQFSQEIRFSSQGYNVWSWIAGIFYEQDTVDINIEGDHTDLFKTLSVIHTHQKTRTTAAFFNIDWLFNDTFTMVIGSRYTFETKEYIGGTTDLNPMGNSCLLNRACAMAFTGPVALSFNEDNISDKQFSWTVGIEYEPTTNHFFYAKLAQGYKSGGFFGGGLTTDSVALEAFEPEKLLAYETGIKWLLLNRSMQFNAAVFYYDYSNVQTFTQIDAGVVATQKLSNVEEAYITGFESDIWLRAISGLEIKFGVGWLDTELGSFNALGQGEIPAGNELPNSAHFSYNGLLRYTLMVVNQYKLSTQIDFKYSDEMFNEAVNIPYMKSDNYLIANARIEINSNSYNWKAALWVRNLTNEQYVVHAADSGAGFGYRNYNFPKTYGISFSYVY